MYTLVRSITFRKFIWTQLPLISLAFLVTEPLKLGSPTLETLAFLAAWFALDLVATWIVELVKRQSSMSNT